MTNGERHRLREKWKREEKEKRIFAIYLILLVAFWFLLGFFIGRYL